MKIALLYGTMSRGGAERVISCLANSFSDKGNDTIIITMDNDKSKYKLNESVRHINLNVSRQSKNIFDSLKRNYDEFKALSSCMKEEKTDMAVSFSKRTAVQLIWIKALTNQKFKIIASERAHPNYDNMGRIEKFIMKCWLPKVEGFVFQTKRVSRLYPQKMQEMGIVIPNGVFEEVLPKDISTFFERDEKKICAVGRLSEQKGYDVLVNAFSRFKKDHSAYTLHIYGEGIMRASIENSIAKLGLEKQVYLHGNVPNVINEIENYGMYVMSSRYEGMPNALMEAMACGLPCISTDCEFGPGELIIDGENGLLVPVDDAEALAAAMSRIADDRVLAQRLSENAVKIRQTHSGKRIAEMYYQYITETMRRER